MQVTPAWSHPKTLPACLLSEVYRRATFTSIRVTPARPDLCPRPPAQCSNAGDPSVITSEHTPGSPAKRGIPPDDPISSHLSKQGSWVVGNERDKKRRKRAPWPIQGRPHPPIPSTVTPTECTPFHAGPMCSLSRPAGPSRQPSSPLRPMEATAKAKPSPEPPPKTHTLPSLP